ncbi:hypothetical protein RUM44_005480 [Polyplax serrata]|uniref:Uncharacterized protein n=1 Tax=Polyplax serrata TaxID=468196 RepID=A0ABR1AD37_POLSC
MTSLLLSQQAMLFCSRGCCCWTLNYFHILKFTTWTQNVVYDVDQLIRSLNEIQEYLSFKEDEINQLKLSDSQEMQNLMKRIMELEGFALVQRRTDQSTCVEIDEPGEKLKRLEKTNGERI